MTKLATVVAITALACVGSLRAHHSARMFDSSKPIWLKGTVVRYEPVNPHPRFVLEQKEDDGQVQTWTVEGPNLPALTRRGVDPADFLKAGDVIEVCGFAFTDEALTLIPPESRRRLPPLFLHGHLLVMPDGEMSLWGSYGKLDNCVRPGDQTQTWLDFLNEKPGARDFWCRAQNFARVASIAPPAFVAEINTRLSVPCP